jgi:poly-gamma-glutamate synthesis protein (capsule biosynthesis protein)
MAWERLLLDHPRWSGARDTLTIRGDAVQARLLALGDVALIRSRASDSIGSFDGLQGLLDSADLRIANLEAVVTSRRQPAVKTGLRAEPDVLGILTAAGFDVVSAANNHALDSGCEGLADSLALLRAAGIGVCGVEETAGEVQWVTRTVNSVRVGFLGFCDDINAATATGMPRPRLWSREESTAAIAAARGHVDVLIVQLHWGYEFSLHPLRRHRDDARRAVDAGAHAVICQHAHVPQGIEIWNNCPIAYGLGNGFMPISGYLRAGHPWVDRSYALELGLAANGIATARLHPLRLRENGSPVPLSGSDGNALLACVSRMSARLGDDAFLDRCERARLAYEAVRLAQSLQEAAAKDRETLEGRVALLDLPRQKALLDFLSTHPHTISLANALRAASAARHAHGVAGVLSKHAPELKNALEGVRALYRWRDALSARVP